MFNKISQEVLNQVFETYMNHKKPNMLSLTDGIKKDLNEAFSHPHSGVIHSENWDAFVLLFVHDNKITLNPWFFGGLPIGNPLQHKVLIDECLQYFHTSPFTTLELISSVPAEIPIPHAYNYADMLLEYKNRKTLSLDHQMIFKPITDIPLHLLQENFKKAFEVGDAKFYPLLDDDEKNNFWSYLGYEDALTDPCSIAMMEQDKLVGFSLALDFGEGSKHISCMCIDPNYQGQKLGQVMMTEIFKQAGNMDITLGTETHMRAYYLYHKMGFVDTQVRYHYVTKK